MAEDFNILKQKENIKKEIEETTGMFSQILPFSDLEQEYQGNQDFLRKIPVIPN